MKILIGQSLPGARPPSLNWLQRGALSVLGLALAVVAFFFITAVLVVVTLAGLAIAVRWWWVMRRVRRAREAAGPLEGEYVRIDRATDESLPR